MDIKNIIKTAELPDAGVDYLVEALRDLSKFEGLKVAENIEDLKQLLGVKLGDLAPIDILLEQSGKDAEFEKLLAEYKLADLPDEQKKSIKIMLWNMYKEGHVDAVNQFSRFNKTAEGSGLGKMLEKVADLLELLNEENEQLRRENVSLRVHNRITKLAEGLVRQGKFNSVDEAKVTLERLISDVADPDDATRVLEKFAEEVNAFDEDRNLF